MQTLTTVEECAADGWILDIVRDDVNGDTRGYIVVAHNGVQSVTMFTVAAGPGARDTAMQYMGVAVEGIRRTGNLPAYKPRNIRYY